MKRFPRVRSVSALLAASVITLAAPALCRAQDDKLRAIEAALGMDPGAMQALERGEVVAISLKENTPRELAAAVAARVHAPFDRVAKSLADGAIFNSDDDVEAVGPIDPNSPAAGLAKFAFTDKDDDEVEKLLTSSASKSYNLSDAEWARLAALPLTKKQRNNADDAVIKAANEAYRGILSQRFDNYLKGGIDAIATYARGKGAASSPADDLRAAVAAASRLENLCPDLYHAIRDYPKNQPSTVTHTYLWSKEEVEGRPAAILQHRFTLSDSTGLFMVNRQFFVGHTYNAMEVTFGVVPHGDGVVMFYGNRTSTDMVAGNGLIHKIGHDRMMKETKHYIQELKEKLESVK